MPMLREDRCCAISSALYSCNISIIIIIIIIITITIINVSTIAITGLFSYILTRHAATTAAAYWHQLTYPYEY